MRRDQQGVLYWSMLSFPISALLPEMYVMRISSFSLLNVFFFLFQVAGSDLKMLNINR